jgi:hypothetical protein
VTKILAATSMAALLAASVPIGGDSGMWAQWGLAGLVVAYTLWRDMDREKRMATALAENHAWVRQTLLAALERNSAALERMDAKLEPRPE